MKKKLANKRNSGVIPLMRKTSRVTVQGGMVSFYLLTPAANATRLNPEKELLGDGVNNNINLIHDKIGEVFHKV